jgi:cytochrome oxidase Cu insertion factor (SCO1/SenC/PrrC family)
MKKSIFLLTCIILLTLTSCSTEEQNNNEVVVNEVESQDDQNQALDTANDTNNENVDNTNEMTNNNETSVNEEEIKETPQLQLPDSLPDGRGGEIVFDDFKGKYLLVSFFGVW